MSDTGAVSGPLRVQLTRGAMVESVHEVHAVMVGPGGRRVVFGDPDRPVLPRSSVKMVQAMPLVLTGAADAFGLDDAELALACASHSSEPRHIDRVRSWLAKIGVDEAQLECGTPPEADGPIDHECSGKHAGYLTVARHLGLDPAGYTHPDHPVQKLVTAELAATFAFTPEVAEVGIDGCGVPVHPVSLDLLAHGIARFATPPSTWPAGRAVAATRLASAMRAHPLLVGGTERLCSELMADTDDLIAKVGAEGVYLAAAIDGEWGVAVKVLDGAIRAAELAVLHLVERTDRTLSERLVARRVIRSAAGAEVGTALVAVD